nr:MAG TPA: hypothetical protein [Caudoviricetes sp.]
MNKALFKFFIVISLLVKLWYSLVSLFSLNNPFLTFRVDL